MYVSLSSAYSGNACAIKQSIDKYVGNKKTQFFDWLVCSMKSINEVLVGNPLLFEKTFIYPNALGTTSINFQDFHLCVSHHDITIINNNSIAELTEKYTRRYERFINLIKSETNISFIRYINDDIEEDQINIFIENIVQLNPTLKFKIILVSDTMINSINNAYVEYISLNNYTNDEIENETDLYRKTILKYKKIYL